MTATSLADSRHETIPEYVLRGRGLFETYSEQILSDYLGAGKWLIPSGSSPEKVYEVRPGTRRKAAKCECRGFTSHKHCSHVEAASIAHRRSAVCDACGERCWYRHLVEVQENDELGCWYPGDLLCDGCIDQGAWA